MAAKTIEVRQERAQDIEAIRALNLAAFGRNQEAELVDALREKGGILLSLVAVNEKRVAGHILFTPVSVSCTGEEVVGAGLGPMAVLPALQRKGIGGELIRAGYEKLKTGGWPFIVVLGHPAYYPRFGFRPARAFGIRCQWNVPDDAFMISYLAESRMKGVCGLAKYRSEFSEAL